MSYDHFQALGFVAGFFACLRRCDLSAIPNTFLPSESKLRTAVLKCKPLSAMHTMLESCFRKMMQRLHGGEKAAEQGDAESQFNLGPAYEMGLGVPKNFVAAARWYLKAAEQGFASAQQNLGLLYLLGPRGA
jgi:hypothetical protein